MHEAEIAGSGERSYTRAITSSTSVVEWRPRQDDRSVHCPSHLHPIRSCGQCASAPDMASRRPVTSVLKRHFLAIRPDRIYCLVIRCTAYFGQRPVVGGQCQSVVSRSGSEVGVDGRCGDATKFVSSISRKIAHDLQCLYMTIPQDEGNPHPPS